MKITRTRTIQVSKEEVIDLIRAYLAEKGFPVGENDRVEFVLNREMTACLIDKYTFDHISVHSIYDGDGA